MTEQNTPLLNVEAAREKATESARRAARFVDANTAVIAEKASRTGRRMARSVSEKLRSGASRGGHTALSKLTDAGIKLTGKQQAALERLKNRISD